VIALDLSNSLPLSCFHHQFLEREREILLQFQRPKSKPFRLAPHRGDFLRVRELSQNGNRSSFGTHPESATGGPVSAKGPRHRGISPDPKTLHLLTFVADPNYPRHILNQLGRSEGRKRISRKVFMACGGELQQRYRECQRDRLGRYKIDLLLQKLERH
jgi:hypothetical protein